MFIVHREMWEGLPEFDFFNKNAGQPHFEVLMQERCNSFANVLE